MRQYLNLFRNRSFLLHWLAGAISHTGDFFNSLALVKILSEDPAHFGLYTALVMIAKVLPGALFGPVAGVMADRLPRRTIMIASDLIRAVLILAMVVVKQPNLLIGLVFLSALVSTFFAPASNALLPSLVAKEELVTASSLSIMTQRSAMLLGNGIGAAVLMQVGPHNVFYIDAVSFVVSAVLLMAMVAPAVVSPEAPRQGERVGLWQQFKGDLGEALAFVRESHQVRHLMITLAIVAVGDASLGALLPSFYTLGLGISPEQIGYVWALFGIASVVGALGLGALGKRVNWRQLLTYGGLFGWLMIVGALVARSPIPSVAFMTMLGIGSGALNVGIQAAVGELVPDWVRGRIFGAWGMGNSVIYVASTLAAGALSDSFGPNLVLLGFVTPFLLAAVYAFFAFRQRGAEVAAN